MKNPDKPYKDESSLWQAFQDGDEQAYELLYRNYFSTLYRYGRKFTPNTTLIEDCIQDLFIGLWKGRQQLQQPASVKNYLLKSLRQRIFKQTAALTKSLHQSGIPEEYDKETMVSYEFELIGQQTEIEQHERVNRALLQLSKRQKEAVFLKFYNNLSYQEVAAIMNISIEAVYNLISKSVALLQKTINKIYILLLVLMLG